MDRRKALKVGAITGVAGALTVAGMGELGRTSSALGSSTQGTSSFEDRLSGLVGQNILQPFNSVTFFYVPPNSSVTINHKVPFGYISLITENRINVDKDHALQMAISIDGQRVLYDPDLIQARYERALNFLSPSFFRPIRDSFTMSLTNVTSKTRYFSSMESGASMLASQWDAMKANLR
jgi:hypothetical protein